MASGLVPGADWRDDACYASLLGGERSIFAWEWLRRSPDYRCAVDGRGDPCAFGLVDFVAYDLAAPAARPLWLRAWNMATLLCEVVGPDDAGLELGQRSGMLVSHSAGRLEHLLISDGLQSIRIDACGGTLLAGPVAVRWQIEGMAAVLPATTALKRLLYLQKHDRFARVEERRAARWIMALRTHDGLAAGATYREIAAVLYGPHAAGARWWRDSPYWGLRIQRLATAARHALDAGPQPWLAMVE